MPVVRAADQSGDRLMIRGKRANAAFEVHLGLGAERQHGEQPLARLLAAPRLAAALSAWSAQCRAIASANVPFSAK